MEAIDISTLERYGFCDPASSKVKVKRARARQAIIVIGVDGLARVIVLFAWAGRLQTSRFRDKIVDVYDQFSPRLFGIEANAMQVLFGDLVKEAARMKLKIRPRIVPVIQPTKVDKIFRIRTSLEPVLNAGRLVMFDRKLSGQKGEVAYVLGKKRITSAGHQDELMNELRSFPTGQTLDLVDALASAISLVPRRQREEQKSAEIVQLAAYLRRTGVHPARIEQRIAEVEEENDQRTNEAMSNG